MEINGQTLQNFCLVGKFRILIERTDNAIKNHFYSKLRKFIRKILKQINKENLLKTNGIDSNKYNSDRIYKMIKKSKLPYNSLNKDAILNMIINFEKNSKGMRNESLLNKKTAKKKSVSKKTISKENLYSEKVLKRYSHDRTNSNPMSNIKANLYTKEKNKYEKYVSTQPISEIPPTRNKRKSITQVSAKMTNMVTRRTAKKENVIINESCNIFILIF
jgi:hypothetical protein